VPTASLAAVLVYTGYKLMNPANVRRLLSYGGIPVVIYAVTVIMIVATDLLTGLLCGLALSLASVVYDLVHLSVKVGTAPGRIDVHLQGAATFIRMPRLVDVLEKLPNDVEAHVHIQNLSYVDHACLDAISTWEKQRNARGTKTVVEWDELMAKYRTRPGARGPESAVAA